MITSLVTRKMQSKPNQTHPMTKINHNKYRCECSQQDRTPPGTVSDSCLENAGPSTPR